jgi:hypothetical protein
MNGEDTMLLLSSKIANVGQPPPHVYGESSRKGFGRLAVVSEESNGPFRGDGHTGTESNKFRSTINDNVPEASIVSDINIDRWDDRDEQWSVDGNFQPRKCQDVTPSGKVDPCSDFKVERRVKERPCRSLDR